ncbi:MAG: citryl-CoA lyase [Gammaproteobacteria bacterium]|nr:citryl-CoA lyase [Gammaproteobacteria bacterium]
MITKDMSHWETNISQVISNDDEEEILIRGHKMSDLIGNVTFAGAMFLMLQGRLPSTPENKLLDALLVASIEHGIAPPSMVSRCFASYGTSIQAAVGGGVLAFGDRMGGLGEQLAKLLFECVQAHGLRAGEQKPIAAAATAMVQEHNENRARLPGFGIPLHGADPRAPHVLDIARSQGLFGVHCELAVELESALASARGGRRVPMNLDGVGAAVILDLGFDWQAARLFLITPRTVSMGAHYLEEVAQDSAWRHIPAEQIDYTGG